MEQSNDERKAAKRHKRLSKKSRKAEAAQQTYGIVRTTGGRFSNLRPVFSKDERYVFLSTKAEARVYSASTGELVRSLHSESKSHRGPIVSILLHPQNEFRLITVSLQGTILIWDWTDGALLQDTQVESSTEVISSVLIGTTFLWTDGKAIMSTSEFPSFKKVHRVAELKVCLALLHIGNDVFAHGDKQIMSFRVKEDNSGIVDREYIKLPKAATSVAVSNDQIAYSEDGGAIYIQTLASLKAKDTTARKLHWHASSVSTLSFALNGEYLLSAGNEGVLVLWQLSTSNKQFLPRISHQIDMLSVSPTSKAYALKLSDNSVKLIEAATLSLQAEIIGPRYTPGGTLSLAAHKENLFVANGPEVQMWHNPTARTTHRTPVTGETFAGTTKTHRVQESQISACAVFDEWMATIDSWSPPFEELVDLGYMKPQEETFLKFWKWNGREYELITRIDAPHGTAPVKEILAVSDGSFVTAGLDAAVKLWRKKPIKKDLLGGGTEVVGTTWSCRRVFQFQSSPVRCGIAMTKDNSVLAISVKDLLYLVDFTSGSIRATLPNLNIGKIMSVGFVGIYLIALGSKKIVSWDLLASSVQYSLRLPEATIRSQLSCSDKLFALSTEESASHGSTNAGKLFIFDPTQAKPIYRQKCLKTLAIAYTSDSCLVQLNNDMEFVYFDSNTSVTNIKAIPQTDTSQTNLAQLYPPTSKKMNEDAMDVDQEGQTLVLSTQKVAQIFETPSIDSLEKQFEELASLVLGKPTSAFEEA